MTTDIENGINQSDIGTNVRHRHQARKKIERLVSD